MTANIALASQIVTLLMLAVLIWRAGQMKKHTIQINDAIKAYRKEIEWLTARIETLEQGRQSQKVT